METGSVRSSTESGLLVRVRNMLLRPDREWGRIELEPATVRQLYRGYVAPLAAIPVLAGFFGSVVFGFSALGITYRPTVGSALIIAIVHYLLTLIGVYALALVIDGLAPTFQATRDRIQAFKVAAYSGTAAWVAGIFLLLPPLSVLTILGLFSLYLLYAGLPQLMKAPEAKARPYAIVAIVAALAVWFAINALTAPVAAMFGAHLDMGRLSVADGPAIDMGSVAAPARTAAAILEDLDAAASSPLPAVPPANLEAFLPAAFAGLERTEVETASGIGGGLGAFALARYANDTATASLKIADMVGMGKLAALGSAFNVASSRTTATGYERVGKVGGRLTTEEWDRTSRTALYSVIVADRFVIEVEGQGLDMNDLKKTVSGIDIAALERLAGYRS